MNNVGCELTVKLKNLTLPGSQSGTKRRFADEVGTEPD